MKAGAVEAVGAEDAKGLAGRAGLAVLLLPLLEQRRGRVGAAGADELVAERVGDARIGQSADAALHRLPLVAGNHQLLIRRGASAEDHGTDLDRFRAGKRRGDEHVRRLVQVRLRYRNRDCDRPLQLGRPGDDGEKPPVAPARPGHRTVGLESLERRREMDLPAAEPLDQRFVEAARIGEEREPSPRQNAPCVAEDREQVAPQQRLATGEEDVIDAVRRALVQDRLPLV